MDEFRELNLAEPIESHCRLVHNCGEKADYSNFDLHTQVTDLDISLIGKQKTVTGIHLVRTGKSEQVAVSADDLIFVTNGSMTENSTLGSMYTPAILNRDKVNCGCWNLWKNIATKDPSFGHPEVFCNDIDKTKWESFTMTFKGPYMDKFLKVLTD